MSDAVKQGFFLPGMFDREFLKERKNDDGSYRKVNYLGFLIRSESGTELCEVRTKKPEKYAHLKRDQVVTIQVFLRGYKDVVYFSDER